MMGAAAVAVAAAVTSRSTTVANMTAMALGCRVVFSFATRDAADRGILRLQRRSKIQKKTIGRKKILACSHGGKKSRTELGG
jgi:hypothetical protein